MKQVRLRFHLHPDAVEWFARGVEHATCRLWSHVHNQATLTIPSLDSLNDISIGRHHGPIRREIVDRPLHLVEDEYRWPSVVVYRFLFIGG